MDKIMNTIKKSWRPLAGLIGLVIVIIWSSGACTKKVAPAKLNVEEGFALPASAETITVHIEPVASRIDVVGTTASEERINLSARIPAYVEKVFVSAGDKVKKGQVLIKLDDREIKEQLAAAEAQLGGSSA